MAPVYKKLLAGHKPRAFLLLFFFVFCFFTYRKAIHSEFIYDDTIRIASVRVDDGKIHFEPIQALRQGLGFVLGSALADRPLLMTTVWINYKISGVEASGYKATNIALHALAAAVLFFFLLRTMCFFQQPQSALAAAFIALVFVAHPLHNQAVTMVIQRGAILSTIFSLLSMISAYSFLEGKNWNYSLLSAFLFLCALLSKPNALTLPLILALFALLAGKRRGLGDLLIPQFIACLFPVVFYLGYGDNFHEQSKTVGSWLNYGLVQSKVVFHYLRQVLWPSDINSTYPIADSASLTEAWPFIVAHAVILGVSGYFARKKNLVAIAGLAFYASLIPESSFFPIPHVVFDHRMYFPFIFLALALHAAIAKIQNEFTKRGILVALLLAAGALSLVNDERNAETRTYVDWIVATARKNPEDHLASINALNMLWSLRPHNEGRALAEKLRAHHNNAPEYEVFYKLFFAESAEHERALVQEVLTTPAFDYLTSITRSNLLQWQISFLKKIPDVNEAREAIHVLLSTQEKFFADPRYEAFLAFYKINRVALHQYYLRQAKFGLLTPRPQFPLDIEAKPRERDREKNSFRGKDE